MTMLAANLLGGSVFSRSALVTGPSTFQLPTIFDRLST
jgi:hypothetical protein